MFDVILRQAQVIDGQKNPRFQADLGICGDRIQAIGDLAQAQAAREIDMQGKVVAPGFIEVHAHSDGWLLKQPHLEAKTRQGFTTEVLMVDGISYAPVNKDTALPWMHYLRSVDGLKISDYTGWESLTDYLSQLDEQSAQNVATHIPYANVRTLINGFSSRAIDDAQQTQIKSLIAEGMEEGAVGLSTGLDYLNQCFATTRDLVDACSAMRDSNGLYVSHIRYKRGILEGVKEAVEIGKRAQVDVHISHLKSREQETVDSLLSYIDDVARNEVKFSFDVYPYQSSSTMLNYILPYEVWEDGPLGVAAHLCKPIIRRKLARVLAHWSADPDQLIIAWTETREGAAYHGMSLTQLARERNQSLEDAVADFLIEESLAVLLVIRGGNDRMVYPMLQHDLCVMATDGVYYPDSQVHPRVYGSVGRLLGPLVRDENLFSLEDAIYKLTALPAERFGLKERGRLLPGSYADLVVLDPHTIQGPATYEDPHQFTTGISHVMVNGRFIIDAGRAVDYNEQAWPGRFIKAHR